MIHGSVEIAWQERHVQNVDESSMFQYTTNYEDDKISEESLYG